MITKSNLNKLEAKDPKVKYGFAKELLQTAADSPEALYEYFNYWNKLISGNNKILKWTAIDIIGHLSAIDDKNKINDMIIGNLIEILHGGVLISCNHAIFALGLIARNKPDYQSFIFNELFAISKDQFDTEECRNIATGKVLDVIKSTPEHLKGDTIAIEFIKNASISQRNSTRKKAEQLLHKLSII